jgi:hypothetical protein
MIDRAMNLGRVLLLLAICSLLGGCDDMQVYGSVGVSSYGGYGGYHGSPRMGTSVSVGGRIY